MPVTTQTILKWLAKPTVLGYAVAWAAEAYGSDAATVLSWIAAQTTTIDVGSAIFQFRVEHRQTAR